MSPPTASLHCDSSLPSSLSLQLSSASQSFTHLNLLSRAAHLGSTEWFPGGNTRSVLHHAPFPLVISSAKSCTLTTLDGQTYIDFLGEYTAGIFGHSHPVIRNAIEAALQDGWNYGAPNKYESRLAQMVCERFRPTMEMVRFTNSGTEANMLAIATAIAFTDKKKILVFEGGYHGSTISFPSGTDWKKSVNLPHEWLLAPYNSVEGTRAVVAESAGDLAAILVEPMQGNAGAVAGRIEFLRYLRELATESGAMLIFDEVMTSRLAYRGLGYKIGVQPDLMTVGKYIGGGMSFGAFGGRRDVMDLFDPRKGTLRHAGTFNNNILSMAAGCAGCDILNEHVINELNELGDKMKTMVKQVLEKYSTGLENVANEPPIQSTNGVHKNGDSTRPHKTSHLNMYINGVGSILNIGFSGTEKALLLQLFFHHMLDEGIYLAPRGFIAMSIEIRLQHVEKFAAAVESFVVKYRPFLVD
ncbi:hypothetical protein MMC20_004060 [Loxospora ochrophaea]|nr:hypothetical protein [Loxospora ochrophaea]